MKRLLAFLPVLVALVIACGSGWAQNTPEPAASVDLEHAVTLALAHNHALLSARTGILQSQADEVTAAIRPNPVFTYDDLYIPITPGQLTGSNINQVTEFDLGASFTWERGRKRAARVAAAKDQTAVVKTQVYDNERTLTFNVAQQFVNILLAKSTLDFARQDEVSFEKTVGIAESQWKSGGISEGDYLKIKLQLLQFQTDVSSAASSLVQARASLRQALGFDAVRDNYDVTGELEYRPLSEKLEDLEALALNQRPDLIAARQGVTAADSQHHLAQANGKRNLTTTFDYTHVSALNTASFTLNIEIPIWDRNQGEIARTAYAQRGAVETERAAEDQVRADVQSAYGNLAAASKVAELYESGYLKQAEKSRDISEYAYHRGAASLLDFLDAERSFRSTQLAYRQALANYMLAVEQTKEVVGTRNLP